MSSICPTAKSSSSAVLKKCGPRRNPTSGRKSQRICRSASSLWTPSNPGMRIVTLAPRRDWSRCEVTSKPARSARRIRWSVRSSERRRIASTPTSSITS